MDHQAWHRPLSARLCGPLVPAHPSQAAAVSDTLFGGGQSATSVGHPWHRQTDTDDDGLMACCDVLRFDSMRCDAMGSLLCTWPWSRPVRSTVASHCLTCTCMGPHLHAHTLHEHAQLLALAVSRRLSGRLAEPHPITTTQPCSLRTGRTLFGATRQTDVRAMSRSRIERYVVHVRRYLLTLCTCILSTGYCTAALRSLLCCSPGFCLLAAHHASKCSISYHSIPWHAPTHFTDPRAVTSATKVTTSEGSAAVGRSTNLISDSRARSRSFAVRASSRCPTTDFTNTIAPWCPHSVPSCLRPHVGPLIIIYTHSRLNTNRTTNSKTTQHRPTWLLSTFYPASALFLS